MLKVCYSEPDGPDGMGRRLEAAGHAGYAPLGQDIVCAAASTLMQALVCLLAGERNASSDAWDEPDGPRLSVTATAPLEPWVAGAFDLVKAGFALLAERYPENLRFADISRSGKQGMLDLQLFAQDGAAGGEGQGSEAPALSRAQQQQAVASGTMKAGARAPAPAAAAQKSAKAEPVPKAQPAQRAQMPLPPRGANAVRALHARWAAEEAMLRRAQPDFSLQSELKNPEMRRLMQLPGMRMQDAYRLAHYSEQLQKTAQAVEQGVMERIRQRAARPAENGTHPARAAAVHTDVAHTTLAQREEFERQALHGAKIKF